MSVHHVHMDTIRPGLFGQGHLFAQTGKVGGEDGWGQLHHGDTHDLNTRTARNSVKRIGN